MDYSGYDHKDICSISGVGGYLNINQNSHSKYIDDRGIGSSGDGSKGTGGNLGIDSEMGNTGDFFDIQNRSDSKNDRVGEGGMSDAGEGGVDENSRTTSKL
jgi:hypothetical protein